MPLTLDMGSTFAKNVIEGKVEAESFKASSGAAPRTRRGKGKGSVAAPVGSFCGTIVDAPVVKQVPIQKQVQAPTATK